MSAFWCDLKVNFLYSCILTYFHRVIAAYSVYKKFVTFPLVRGLFAGGAPRFWRFCANFLAF